ncbi:Gnat domain, partial [Globisporangium splendens]
METHASLPPQCAVCNHRHEQSAESVDLFSVQAVDCFAGHTTIQHVNRGFWSFMKILRAHIFPDNPTEYEDDSRCRHLIAFVGDSPIGMGRWRISQDVDGVAGSTTVVVIEQFGILASKRQQGYGTKFLRRIVEDVSSKLTQMRLRVPALVAYVRDTNETALPAVNVFQACGFALDPQRHGTSDMSCLRLSLTKSAESTSE